MKKVILSIIMIIVSCNLAYARYTQTSNIKYKTNNGFSKYYTVDVTFYTGQELNNLTKTYNYDNYGKYATVFWTQDQVSIIKISSFLSCSTEFTNGCINDYFNMEGTDQNNINWEICTKSYCY